MKFIIYFFCTFFAVVFYANWEVSNEYILADTDSVSMILEKLGDRPVNHKLDKNKKNVSAEVGRDLIFNGFSKIKGQKKAKQQSKHFVCTSCHNTKIEDPNLAISDPQARLEYVARNDMPFLQGTTLYGAVNRTSFYNGDYDKKYGKLVDKARYNLREAIQLCAVECAQGRKLKSWEIESILAYLWENEYQLSDLNLSPTQRVTIQNALNGKANEEKAIKILKSAYLQGSPASFVHPPPDRKMGAKLKGDPENGKLIYDYSCKHCHADEAYSFFKLDDEKITFDHLNKHFPRYTRYSVYQVARFGTPVMNGKKAYMPQYTSERMSDQQLEDLRAYVKERSGE